MTQAYKDPVLPPPPDLPDGPAWLDHLTTLSPEIGETLESLVFTLCPHDDLPARVYRRVVLVFDHMAAQSPETAALIDQTVDALEAVLPLTFRARAEHYRVAALKAIEETPGFVLLQRTAVRYLYDDLEVWQAFGYEGASTHLGGYVERGFDDLDWLPPVPAEDGEGEKA